MALELEYQEREQSCVTGMTLTTVSAFKFVILLGDFVIREFDQYDSAGCHIKDYDDTKAEADRYLLGLCIALDTGVPKMKRMVQRSVPTEQWVEYEPESDQPPARVHRATHLGGMDEVAEG